ncbi:MAG: hypothetical protein COB33_002970 [Thiotrichaceae bacterium]|nr:hypothetical protein [Thiotrichaceae bacterium]
MKGRRFYDCDLSEKLLYTAFLLLMGLGYLMALTYLYISHQGHDGEPGLSIHDIAETYYGNRSGTQLEAALRGPMAGYINPEERTIIVAWLKSGANEPEFESSVKPIIDRQCLMCHSTEAAKQFGNTPALDSFENVHKVAAVDTGLSLLTLVKLSHIHLLGIGLVLLGIGFIFCLVELRPMVKYTLILAPFIAIVADIMAWFLTKWDPVYAYTVVTSGALLGVAMAAQILISLYQIWFLKEK